MAAPLQTSEATNWYNNNSHLSLVPEYTSDETLFDPYATSREVFNTYFDLRDQALDVEKIEGEELKAVQDEVREYVIRSDYVDLPDTPEERFSYYTNFPEDIARKKIIGLVDYLERNHADKVSPVELEATRAFIDSTFTMYQSRPKDGRVAPDADGSFAFVVPARVGRNHPDYGQEVDRAIPGLRYVPNELRAAMLTGLPPFVIDTYQYNSEGRRGYLMFAPVYEDMAEDLGSRSDFFRAARQNVNAAVDFAQERFGVTVVGLGATLPSITKFGSTVTNKNVVTTTGHGGTVDIIRKTVEAVHDGKEFKTIGVLGLGSIGESIARVMANEHPEAKIHVYDPRQAAMDKVTRDSEQFVAESDEKAIISASEIVISAITSRLDLRKIGIENLNGTIFVDDSMPASIDPGQAKELGGAAVWVIARDIAATVARRRGYDYATMVDSHSDLFGCEAEAASIAEYQVELRRRGMTDPIIKRIIDKVAINGPVNVKAVRLISALFTKYGVLPSEPQAFGEPVVLPGHAA